MKLKNVHFIHPVSFHGTISSASVNVVSDVMRPGSTPFVIDLGEYGGFPGVRLSKMHNGSEVSTIIPITNVANFTTIEDAKAAKK